MSAPNVESAAERPRFFIHIPPPIPPPPPDIRRLLKPKPLTWRQKIWERETGKFLRRTPQSWGKILFFYLCFYTVLLFYFWGLWSVFSTMLTEEEPMYQMDKSVLGAAPGMDYRPRETEYTFGDVGKVMDELEDFLRPYYKAGRLEAFQGPCTSANSYNYKVGQPCIFLKLNRIFGWEPAVYLPGEEPNEISGMSHDVIPVTCKGRDRHPSLSMSYFPPGFSRQYYPFKNQKGYLSPLVAVSISGLTNGTVARIECKAWAPNIEHDPVIFRGSVRFRVKASS